MLALTNVLCGGSCGGGACLMESTTWEWAVTNTSWVVDVSDCYRRFSMEKSFIRTETCPWHPSINFRLGNIMTKPQKVRKLPLASTIINGFPQVLPLSYYPFNCECQDFQASRNCIQLGLQGEHCRVRYKYGAEYWVISCGLRLSRSTLKLDNSIFQFLEA